MEQNGPAPAPKFVIDPDGPDVHRQLIEQILDRVALGQLGTLRPGDKLPTVVQLEEDLGVSHGTIVRVNKYLESIGVARGQQKGGTRILDMPADVREAVIDGFAGRRLASILLELKRSGVPVKNVKRAFEEQINRVYGAATRAPKKKASAKKR